MALVLARNKVQLRLTGSEHALRLGRLHNGGYVLDARGGIGLQYSESNWLVRVHSKSASIVSLSNSGFNLGVQDGELVLKKYSSDIRPGQESQFFARDTKPGHILLEPLIFPGSCVSSDPNGKVLNVFESKPNSADIQVYEQQMCTGDEIPISSQASPFAPVPEKNDQILPMKSAFRFCSTNERGEIGNNSAVERSPTSPQSLETTRQRLEQIYSGNKGLKTPKTATSAVSSSEKPSVSKASESQSFDNSSVSPGLSYEFPSPPSTPPPIDSVFEALNNTSLELTDHSSESLPPPPTIEDLSIPHFASLPNEHSNFDLLSSVEPQSERLPQVRRKYESVASLRNPSFVPTRFSATLSHEDQLSFSTSSDSPPPLPTSLPPTSENFATDPPSDSLNSCKNSKLVATCNEQPNRLSQIASGHNNTQYTSSFEILTDKKDLHVKPAEQNCNYTIMHLSSPLMNESSNNCFDQASRKLTMTNQHGENTVQRSAFSTKEDRAFDNNVSLRYREIPSGLKKEEEVVDDKCKYMQFYLNPSRRHKDPSKAFLNSNKTSKVEDIQVPASTKVDPNLEIHKQARQTSVSSFSCEKISAKHLNSLALASDKGNLSPAASATQESLPSNGYTAPWRRPRARPMSTGVSDF